MALLWSHEADGSHYEVRSAGASLRLYRNGVNHSQWNPNRPLSGSIWDLITLPALHRPTGALGDALMLGFGAGAVARQLCDLAGIKRLVGVEMDPMHLSIAQGFFECSEQFELVAADAVEWVGEGDESPQYDLIIDDLYSEEDGMPVRCAPMDKNWFNCLVGLLKPGGILVLNTIEPEKVNHLPLLKDRKLKSRLPHAMMYQIDGYENRVLAFSDEAFDRKGLDSALRAICRKYPRCYGVGKRYMFSGI
ncbi:class I SAM-dependent methyltransferase [Coraliomargarita sinensis]|uniref:Class I SAM-dependent methyltransferase n=1 Tax=Coraliomargarita sinensis TaxID=2174842 RepID=A0A317ZJP7_9BACT|nr:class I SAM-dependent methyltransferase [Coraliomargarita sinensis]PXA03999.1 class I SAM-dependent methyltransferase [Coraliomargarita sinensis]